MFPPIHSFLEEYEELTDFLIKHKDLSLSTNVNHHYRKIYLLSCASYYEMEIVKIIKDFVEINSADERIINFITNKAIARQYHTYFEWDQKNINKFLGYFGSRFKNSVSIEISNSPILTSQVEAFLAIGNERNKMVHENFLVYTLDKTFSELRDLDRKATRFINYLKTKFNEIL